MRAYGSLLSAAIVFGASVGRSDGATAQVPWAFDCPTVVSVLRVGALSQTDSQMVAHSLVSACGAAGGQALAAAMLRRRDAAWDGDMDVLFRPPVTDTAVFRAALELSADAGAGLPARILSLRVLGGFIVGDISNGFDDITSVGRGEYCPGIGGIGRRTYHLNSLDADAAARIRAVALPLEIDTTAPAALRSAATCVMSEWRLLRGVLPQLLNSAPSAMVLLVAECESRFRVLNHSLYEFQLEFELPGDSARHTMRLPGATIANEPYSMLFFADSPGEMRLFYDGELLSSLSSSSQPCRE